MTLRHGSKRRLPIAGRLSGIEQRLRLELFWFELGANNGEQPRVTRKLERARFVFAGRACDQFRHTGRRMLAAFRLADVEPLQVKSGARRRLRRSRYRQRVEKLIGAPVPRQKIGALVLRKPARSSAMSISRLRTNSTISRRDFSELR